MILFLIKSKYSYLINSLKRLINEIATLFFKNTKIAKYIGIDRTTEETVFESSESYPISHNQQIKTIPIHPIKDDIMFFKNSLEKTIFLIISLATQASNVTIIISEITVVAAAPSYDHSGINTKFNSTLTTPAMIALYKTFFSRLAGISTQYVKIIENIEKINVITMICKDKTEFKYFSPAIIKTISLLNSITPTAAGSTNIDILFITLDRVALYSLIFFFPRSIDNLGIVAVNSPLINPLMIV